jgi:aspartate/methionine/tyrosine aminotransferase
MTHKHSDYMHWAKTRSRARFHLATSGVGPFPLSELGFDWTGAEINGDNSYGFRPLQSAIAGKYGLDPASVVTAEGTSMANYLAMATILEPGDEVLVEHPAYGLLLDAVRYIGAEVRRFARREEHDYALDPEEIRRAITPRTRLIVVTNLHNPSSVLTPEPVMAQVAGLARQAGARLLVDEVYLDAVYENTPPTSAHLGPQVVTTASLTKVYGLSGLRCGWILAEPGLAQAMRRLNDLFAATPVHPAELMAVAAFANLERMRDRARPLVDQDRAALAGFLERETRVSAPPTNFGTTAFLKLKRGEADPFLDRLRNQYETSVVPGRFFEMPNHFRVGMGVDSAMFAEGLKRIALALE